MRCCYAIACKSTEFREEGKGGHAREGDAADLGYCPGKAKVVTTTTYTVVVAGFPKCVGTKKKRNPTSAAAQNPKRRGGGGVKLNRPLPVFSLCFPCLIRPAAAAKSHYHHQKQLPTETDSDVSLIPQNNNRPTSEKNTSAKETNLHLTCRQVFESNGIRNTLRLLPIAALEACSPNVCVVN